MLGLQTSSPYLSNMAPVNQFLININMPATSHFHAQRPSSRPRFQSHAPNVEMKNPAAFWDELLGLQEEMLAEKESIMLEYTNILRQTEARVMAKTGKSRMREVLPINHAEQHYY